MAYEEVIWHRVMVIMAVMWQRIGVRIATMRLTAQCNLSNAIRRLSFRLWRPKYSVHPAGYPAADKPSLEVVAAAAKLPGRTHRHAARLLYTHVNQYLDPATRQHLHQWHTIHAQRDSDLIHLPSPKNFRP